MKQSIIKFIGTGSAFHTKLGCNSGYIAKDRSMIFFDFGGDVFSRVVELGIIPKNIQNIYVFITHTHPDHVSSLGDFIYYCHYILKVKPMIVCGEKDITVMLNIMGVPRDLYELVMAQDGKSVDIHDISFGTFSIIPAKVKHYPNILSFGYLVNIFGKTIYYSGDGCEIPAQVKEMFFDGNIDELYQDTCGLEYENNPHMSLSNLAFEIPLVLRDRVFCMHLDKAFDMEKAKNHGFNITENEFDLRKKRIAVYAGSFDPITNGHKNMISKASKQFDKLVIGILNNTKKTPLFDLDERMKLIKQTIAEFNNVEVKVFGGLQVEFAKQEGASAIIRGLRSVSDFEYELQIGMANKHQDPNIETLFFIPDMEYQYISSSMIKELAYFNGKIDELAPDFVLEAVKDKFKK